jgi:hypothetical protein
VRTRVLSIMLASAGPSRERRYRRLVRSRTIHLWQLWSHGRMQGYTTRLKQRMFIGLEPLLQMSVRSMRLSMAALACDGQDRTAWAEAVTAYDQEVQRSAGADRLAGPFLPTCLRQLWTCMLQLGLVEGPAGQARPV